MCIVCVIDHEIGDLCSTSTPGQQSQELWFGCDACTTRGIVIHRVILSSVSNSVWRGKGTGPGPAPAAGTGAAVRLDMSRRVPSCQVLLIVSHV